MIMINVNVSSGIGSIEQYPIKDYKWVVLIVMFQTSGDHHSGTMLTKWAIFTKLNETVGPHSQAQTTMNRWSLSLARTDAAVSALMLPSLHPWNQITKCITTPKENYWAMNTVNMYKKMVRFDHEVFETCECTERPPLMHIIRSTRLKFFGHIARADPSMSGPVWPHY